MSRRRKSEVEFTMFPFLSVLCAVIGILMLFMIVVITTRVIGAEESAWWAGGDAPQQQPDEPGIQKQRYVALENEILELTNRLVRRQRHYRELSTSYEQLRDRIAAMEDRLNLGSTFAGGRRCRPIGVPEEVLIVPDEDQKDPKTPIFVEVQSDGFIVHPEKTRYELAELEKVKSPLRKYIAGVDRRRSTHYLLMLLHPNGVEAHRKLRKYLLKNHNETITQKREIIPGFTEPVQITKSRIDLGVEPFSRDWLLIPKKQVQD